MLRSLSESYRPWSFWYCRFLSISLSDTSLEAISPLMPKARARELMSRTTSGRRPASTMALYSSEGDSSVLTMSSFPDRAEEQAGQMAGERLNSPDPCWSQKT
ncbi:hypothetical protein EYF80_017744 [Liparis tanakae]|uniref:Uncharacterized protein n=1 Tax=Liparis tanakae TaxID=230148 RepID=A0A4Z2I1L8_9TELE|nr:hypothetical protein EYF80_017744 [Liparis tanakae]